MSARSAKLRGGSVDAGIRDRAAAVGISAAGLG
jgi:hypothetical protein